MKNKSIGILLLFIAFIMLLSCSVNAANVLIISEGDTVHGETVAAMLAKIDPDSFTVEQKAIESNKSLDQTIAELNATGKTYDSVIVQLSYKSNISSDISVNDCISAINKLQAQIGNNANTKYYIGTPVGKISSYDQDEKVSNEAVNKIISGLTTVKVSSIPTFENIKIATDKSIEVCVDNKLTTLGDLLVACTYSNSLGKKVNNLSSYVGLADSDVAGIVGVANATSVAQEVIQEENPGNIVANTTNSISTTNSTNATNSVNTTNSTNTTVNSTNSTTIQNKSSVAKTEKKEEKGVLQKSSTKPGYAAFKTDREPRLKFITDQPNYIYVELIDNAGIACEYPSGNYKANKSAQPKVYKKVNNKEVAVSIKRPKENEYKFTNGHYVYKLGIPKSEIVNQTTFRLVAQDVSKRKHFITEYFQVKNNNGTYVLNRAPTSNIIGLKTNFKQMAAHVTDPTGIASVKIVTLPKSAGGTNDVIRNWNGTIQSDWTTVMSTTTNNKYVVDGLTRFEKIDTVFKKSSWKGLNPKVADKDGVYSIMIMASDASGMSSMKTLLVDTKYYVSGDAWKETGNAKKTKAKSSSKSKKASVKSSKKSSKKKTKSKKSSSKKVKERAAPTNGYNGDGSSTSSSSSSSGSGSTSSSSASTSTKNKVSSGLKKGSKGSKVKTLQKRLNELGWNLSVDGDYGANTEKAVKEFQKLNGLTVDGKVGTKTKNKLNSKNAKGKNNASSSSSSSGGSTNVSSGLKKGSKGEKVKALQRRLNQLGWNLSVDGDFGSNTESAVKQFQSINGLSVDGVVGPNTSKKLNSKDARAIFSSNPGSSGSSSGNSGSSSSSASNSGSNNSEYSKENAEVNYGVFNMFWSGAGKNAYCYLGDYTKDLSERFKGYLREGEKIVSGGFSIICGTGEITEFEVQYDPGMKEVSKPFKTKSGDHDKIIVYPGATGKGIVKEKEYGEIYTTVVGYYKSKTGKWYKDTCRIHFILASTQWWASGKKYEMKSCVPER